MLSDHVFRSKRKLTIAELQAWTGFVRDVAQVETGEVGDAWRIGMTPFAEAACPVELSIRGDQRFDIRIGGETYEDRPIDSLDAFLALLQAIADGRVITRMTRSTLTGAVREIETLVRLADGSIFHARRTVGAAQSGPPPLPGRAGDPLDVRDRHYVPYRKN